MPLYGRWQTKPPQGTPLDPYFGLCQGLVACLPFNDGSGLVAADVTSNGNSASFVGGVSWTAGQYSDALSFNATSGYLSLPATPAGVIGASAFTVSCWVYPTVNGKIVASSIANTIGIGNWLLGYGATGGNNEFGFRLYTASGGGSSITANWATSSGINTWWHVVGVFTGAAAQLYVDGQLVVSASGGSGVATSAGATYVGARNSGGSAISFFGGSIDGFQFWNRALSPGEILNEYQNTFAKFAPPRPYWLYRHLPAAQVAAIRALIVRSSNLRQFRGAPLILSSRAITRIAPARPSILGVPRLTPRPLRPIILSSQAIEQLAPFRAVILRALRSARRPFRPISLASLFSPPPAANPATRPTIVIVPIPRGRKSAAAIFLQSLLAPGVAPSVPAIQVHIDPTACILIPDDLDPFEIDAYAAVLITNDADPAAIDPASSTFIQ
jgi:Concanavalin A-like lectin/glucanases superfamily